MNMNFDVSLIITTYNEEKYLPILLDSIEKQNTSFKMEVIIVDDGSTDDTIEIANKIIEKYENSNTQPFIRCKLMHNDRPHDVQYMRNLGLKYALGKTVLFCDADIALSPNYVHQMCTPILKGNIDTTLCKTYAVLEGFYNIRPQEYSKSYDFYLRHAPRFMLRRFPVQLFPWLALWFKNMRRQKKYLSIWTTPNRAHTTGILTKTSIAKSVGGWNVPIGHGDDVRYSYDIFGASSSVLFDTKSVLYISRRRVFPQNLTWLLPSKLREFVNRHKNDYSDSIR